MSIKKVFHFRPSEITVACVANLALMGHALSLKVTSGKLFWCSFCLHMGIEVQKSALPTLFHFARVMSASQSHVYCNTYLITSPPGPVFGRYLNWAKPVHSDQENSKLWNQTDSIVHRKPQIAKNGSQFSRPVSHQNVDSEERHGHCPDKNIGDSKRSWVEQS